MFNQNQIFIAILVVVAIIAIGAVIWTADDFNKALARNGVKNIINDETADWQTYKLLRPGYLEPGNLTGIAVFKGYYTSIKQSATAFGETKQCDNFIVNSGPNELIKEWLDLVKKGNTLQSKNNSGQIIMNLDLTKLSQMEKNKIKNSNINNQIELLTYVIPAEGREVPACFSRVEIIDIK